ncbi:MAG: LacI family DNA-binding transcriptional regulator [Kiritimatiellia bacterium]
MNVKKDISAPSIVDVAKMADVSLGTVSRIMNGQKSVRPELRLKVFKVAHALGFVPRTQVRRVGVVVGRRNLSMPVGYTYSLTSLLSNQAYLHHLPIDIIDEANMEQALDCRISAVIGVVFNDSFLELNHVPNLPIVSLNHPLVEKGVHSIYTNHFEQGVMATRHLLDYGHRKIAFFGGMQGEWGGQQRFLGYEKAMKDAGIAIKPEWVCHADSGSVFDALRSWLSDGVTGLLNFNEDGVAETLHILSNVLCRRIGEDISVISIEDVPLYQYFTPPQTVIVQPLEEMARLAFDFVDKQIRRKIREPKSPEVLDTCLAAKLVVRRSVGAPPLR